jgi:hypothetical protein
VPVLGQFLGSSARLSQAVITRLTEQWKAEQRAFAQRDMSVVDYVYLRADGRNGLIALADGYREFAESRADVLRDAARRGMRAPVLAVGDGALGFWSEVA